MIFLAEIISYETLVLLDDLEKEVEEIRQTRIVTNETLKEKGSRGEYKDDIRSKKDEVIMTLTKNQKKGM